MISIRYHSKTQLLLVCAPVLIMIGTLLVLAFRGTAASDAMGPMSKVAIAASLLWLFLGGEVMVHLQERGVTTIGFIDISKNTSPSRIERALIKVAWCLFFALPIIYVCYVIGHDGYFERDSATLFFALGILMSCLAGAGVYLGFVLVVMFATFFKVRPVHDAD